MRSVAAVAHHPRETRSWWVIASCVASIVFVGFQTRIVPGTTTQKKVVALPDLLVTATSGNIFSGASIREFPTDHVKFASVRSFPAKDPPTPIHECTFWSVVTTIFEPSEAVRAQADLGREWCLVVVGDRKSPALYNLTGSSHVVYLDVKAQELMSDRFPSFIPALPWNHFGRKNVGFLYAISQGAEAIWDFDDDNIVKKSAKIVVPNDNDLVEFDLPKEHSFSTYNPYVKLGAHHLPAWPRGTPLEHIKRTESYSSPLERILLKGDRIALIQSLADHDPDMDALYRLIMPLPFDFSPPSNAKPILLPERTLAPLNAQACLFKRTGFFMLLLPITVHGRVSDIWRGYAGQRLLWDLGLQLAFAPPLVDQFRNPHSYLGDLDAEIPLYKQAGVLVDRLREWNGTATTLPGRIEELYIDLYERGFLEIGDVYLMQSWIQSLLDIGYQFPPIRN